MKSQKILILVAAAAVILAFAGYSGFRRVKITSLINKGVESRRDGNIKKAEDLFLKAVRIDPGSAEAHFSLATVDIAKKNSLAAKSEIEKAIGLDSTKAEYYAYQSYLYFNQLGKRVEAAAQMKKAAEMDPKNYQYHLALGYYYKRLDQTRNSIHEFETVLKLEPDLNSARDELAALYNKLGDSKKAAALIKEKASHSESSETMPGLRM